MAGAEHQVATGGECLLVDVLCGRGGDDPGLALAALVGDGAAVAQHRRDIEIVPGRGDQVAIGLHLSLADGEVVASRQLQAAASIDAGAHRRLAVGVGDRGQRQVVAGLQGGVAAGGDRHAVQLQVVAGLQGQVVADGQAGAIATAGQAGLIAQGGRLQREVVASQQRGAVAGLHGGAGEAEVAAGLQQQVVAGSDARTQVAAGEGVAAGASEVAAGTEQHVAAGDLAAEVEQVLTGLQRHRAAGHDAALVEQVADVGADIGAADGAGVTQAGRGVERDVAIVAGQQCAVAAQGQRGLRRQVHHRHQHLLALVLLFHHPHDVVGQRGDLVGGQRHAHAQVQGAGLGDAAIEQRAVLGHAVGVVAQVAAAGELGDLVQHQPLLVETIAEAGLGPLRIHAELVEQVIAADEIVVVDETRIGLDQVAAAGRAVVGLDPAQAVGSPTQRVDAGAAAADQAVQPAHRQHDVAQRRADAADHLRRSAGTGPVRRRRSVPPVRRSEHETQMPRFKSHVALAN
ncbi:hypothetical protein NB713_001062 [Xanthomonas sacchari]|nr:hypothetical protein [Xanthomonas sacchari]